MNRMAFRITLLLTAMAIVRGTWAATPGTDAIGADAMCNASTHFSIIGKLPAVAGQRAMHHDARAVWLNASLAKWPGAEPAGRFRLYYSASGQLLAVPGARVEGADDALGLDVFGDAISDTVAKRFAYLADGVVLTLRPGDRGRIGDMHRGQLLLVQEDEQGVVQDATRLQIGAALDDLYAEADAVPDLGATPHASTSPEDAAQTRFKLWAPTARAVSVCLYDDGRSQHSERSPMRRDAHTGVWSLAVPADLSGKSYTYIVDVFVPGTGIVRHRVTDPYAVSLNTDSKRSYIADLNDGKLKPEGWDADRAPAKLQAQTDMVIYELHVRDFSINDPTVSAAHRGKYLAFTEHDSNGMKHLRALSDAGLTDVHLLPVFDFASVPEAGCVTPRPVGTADGTSQQEAVMAVAQRDCFNWGYDPFHFGAPEGSYATNAEDGAERIREFRAMVKALHRDGLRVGMDMVYNHTDASGLHPHAVLDRIVPGYYHRLNAQGVVERSTCCDNTATENAMMAKLMIDTAERWAVQYKIDSFRFDLMAHQPRAAMEALRARVNGATGRDINLIGEGWNFGEVANGVRFVQASQLSLNGTGIGTFSDRGRDAVRGGSAGDSAEALTNNKGYINGLASLDRTNQDRAVLMQAADLVRAGMAGSLRDVVLTTHTDAIVTLSEVDYKGQPAGYVSEPSEVVNYVENHDNQTLFDVNVHRLPANTSREDRARVQILGAAINALSQGVAYFHAGIDTLRSKSLDRNSFNSGDWFNRIDWSYRDNYFGTGLPPKQDNGQSWPVMKPLLADARIKPEPANIAWTRDAFRDLLRIRASSTLFRMRTADDIRQRLRFYNTGSAQNPAVIALHLDGEGYAGARFKEVMVFINVGAQAQSLILPPEAAKAWTLHPVHVAKSTADLRACEAAHEAQSGRFDIPARTAVVFVAAD